MADSGRITTPLPLPYTFGLITLSQSVRYSPVLVAHLRKYSSLIGKDNGVKMQLLSQARSKTSAVGMHPTWTQRIMIGSVSKAMCEHVDEKVGQAVMLAGISGIKDYLNPKNHYMSVIQKLGAIKTVSALGLSPSARRALYLTSAGVLLLGGCRVISRKITFTNGWWDAIALQRRICRSTVETMCVNIPEYLNRYFYLITSLMHIAVIKVAHAMSTLLLWSVTLCRKCLSEPESSRLCVTLLDV